MTTYEENQKKIECILERYLGVLAQNYPLRKLNAGKFARPVTMNTQFVIAHYEIEGVGHLMTMYTEGNPQMQMVTCTLTPYFKALPMMNADFIYSEKAGMILADFYELTENREEAEFRAWMDKYKEKFSELAELPDIPSQPAFYDPIRPVYVSKARLPQYDEIIAQNLMDTLKLFIEQEKSLPLLSEEEKAAQEKIQHRYVDDLIDLNGFSTQAWVKEHGADYVREFYHDIFFGV